MRMPGLVPGMFVITAGSAPRRSATADEMLENIAPRLAW
jgi:hypothetical protein